MGLPEIKIEFDAQLTNKIYDDLFSPSFKKVWEWLWHLVSLVPTIFLPFALLNQYSNYILEKNFKKLENKLKDIKEEDFIKVPSEIWVPLLEKLAYYDNDLLVDLFTELLKNAMNKNSLYKVHPRFIKIVENLSEDDALILQYLSGLESWWKCMLPCIDVQLKAWWWYIVMASNLSFIIKDVKLNNFDYGTLYLDNLKSLWLISISDLEYLTDNQLYDELINYFKWRFETPISTQDVFDYKKKLLSVTPLWIEFLRLVFEKNKK